MDKPSASEVEWNAQAFNNAISWIETARENFDALGQIEKDVAKVLEITDLQDFDKALGTIPRPRDLVKQDNLIRELQKKRAILKARLAQKESDLAMANQKIGEALNLLTQFQSYVGQLGEMVTKAWVFNETVAKTLPVTRAKVINTVVYYSSKMETLLIDMQKLMADLYPTALPSGAIDLSEFPEIPAVEFFHGLSTPTKDAGTKTNFPSLLVDPGSDARTRPVDKPHLPEAPPMD